MPRIDSILELEQKIAALEYENEQNQQNLEDSFAEIEARDEKITNLKMQLKVAESRRSDSFSKELEKMRTKNRKMTELLKVKEKEVEMYKSMVGDRDCNKSVDNQGLPQHIDFQVETVDLTTDMTTKEETIGSPAAKKPKLG